MIQYVCLCGRPYVTENGSCLCLICVAEHMTGKKIQNVTKEEYDQALIVFKNDPKKVEEYRTEMQVS